MGINVGNVGFCESGIYIINSELSYLCKVHPFRHDSRCPVAVSLYLWFFFLVTNAKITSRGGSRGAFFMGVVKRDENQTILDYYCFSMS